jgi:Fic family protein
VKKVDNSNVSKTLGVYQKIADLRQRYYASLAGKEDLVKMILESEVAEQVYNSNAIENSTLSLEETEKILLQLDLDRFVSQRELFEAQNLAKVVDYIDKKAKTQELNLETILFLHKILLNNIRDEVAGRFRTTGEYVRVGSHIGASPENITRLLENMLTSYYASSHLNIIKRIAQLHLTFENIHPFIDGNGRIGRVLNNYLLIREGFVPINIKFLDRNQYYQAFTEFDNLGKTQTMEEIVGKALTSSYHKRLAYLENKEITSLKDYAEKNNLSYSNLLNKASRQTIEAFLVKNVWKIGV